MEIEEYLSQKERRLEKGIKRIKNHRVFDFRYIPEKPLMREEVKPIVDALLRYKKTGIPNNLLIVGSRGSGKTLIVRYLMNLQTMKKNLVFGYANCRSHNTSFKILAHLLNAKPRGCSLNELWQRFQNLHPENCVLVLDEIDMLSDKDRNKEILYLASRSANFMTILLSNNPRFLGILDQSIKSSLQAELVYFNNYTGP